MTSAALPAVVAFLGTLLLGPIVRSALRRYHLVDHPVERSSHTVPTLRGGGVAAALAGIAALLLLPHGAAAVLMAAAGFAALGLAEDTIGVPVVPRLVLQVILGLVVAVLVVHAAPTGAAPLTVAVVTLWLVAYTNAFNFMDGIDGISVAQTVVAGVAFLALGLLHDVAVLVGGGAIAVGCAAGFAPWNLPRARMFLGDVGSYFFGGLLAALAAVGFTQGVPLEAVLGPFALYVADTAVTLVRRARARERWWTPHRSHAYQRLARAGWSHPSVSVLVATISACTAALGAVSTSTCVACRIGADAVALLVLAGYLALPSLVERRALARRPRATPLD